MQNPHSLFVEPGVYTQEAFDAFYEHEKNLRKFPVPMVPTICPLHKERVERCGCQQKRFLDKYMREHPVNPRFIEHIVNEECDRAGAAPDVRARLVADMIKFIEKGFSR